jgi:hypothetical protein
MYIRAARSVFDMCRFFYEIKCAKNTHIACVFCPKISSTMALSRGSYVSKSSIHNDASSDTYSTQLNVALSGRYFGEQKHDINRSTGMVLRQGGQACILIICSTYLSRFVVMPGNRTSMCSRKWRNAAAMYKIKPRLCCVFPTSNVLKTHTSRACFLYGETQPMKSPTVHTSQNCQSTTAQTLTHPPSYTCC